MTTTKFLLLNWLNYDEGIKGRKRINGYLLLL